MLEEYILFRELGLSPKEIVEYPTWKIHGWLFIIDAANKASELQVVQN